MASAGDAKRKQSAARSSRQACQTLREAKHADMHVPLGHADMHVIVHADMHVLRAGQQLRKVGRLFYHSVGRVTYGG